MKTFAKSDEKDKKLFHQLDSYSVTLRQKAESFADFLMPFKNQSTPIDSLIKSLDSIMSSPITKMDISILELEKSLMLINSELSNPNSLSPLWKEKTLDEFMTLNKEMAKCTADLAEKAIELDKQN